MADYLIDLEKEAIEAGTTLYALCERAKVAISNVPRWKRKETSPNMSTIQKLRSALDSFKLQSKKKPRSK